MTKLDPKTDGASLDILGQNIQQMRELFPEVFTEGSDEDGPRWKVDMEALGELLGEYVEDKQERYSFNWHGKARAKRIAQTPSTGTLRPCPEESVNWDTTKNIFIEGDNLEVLKLLQKSYHKKVKMIYIDPPYNTGKEFIYPDKFGDNLDTYLKYTGQVGDDGLKISANSETGGRYHTNWLNMMYPRLKLARNLLRDDGVIVISIDDHEVHNLRNLCDQIFGEENLVAQCVWQKRYSRENRGTIGDAHEYVVFYARNQEQFKEVRNFVSITESQKKMYRNPNKDPRGPWRAIPLTAQGFRPNQMYEIVSPSGKVHTPPEGRCWSTVEVEFEKLKSEERIYFGKNGDAQPGVIRYLDEVKGVVPWSWWPHEEVGHTDEAKKEMREYLGKSAIFDTPKPVRLLTRIIEICTNKDDMILDFFAGSCTTAHAAISHNRKDAGQRRFIMVQLPERCDEKSTAHEAGFKSIAEIGIARLKNYVEKLDSDESTNLDFGFKVLKLDNSNINMWRPLAGQIGEELLNSAVSVVPGRSNDDVTYELLLKYGLDLCLPKTDIAIEDGQISWFADAALVTCLDENIAIETVEAIASLNDEHQPEIMRVVFKDSGFKDDVAKTNAIQILRQRGIEDVKTI